jgi:hypothetical protein
MHTMKQKCSQFIRNELSSRRRLARYVHVKNWNFLFYCSNIAKSENAMLWRMLSRLETCIVECIPDYIYTPMMKKYWKFNLHLCQEQLINVRVSQFSSCFSWDDWFCESGGGEFTKTPRKVCTCQKLKFSFLLLEYCKIRECYAVANAFTIRNMYSLILDMKCNSRKINRPLHVSCQN